MTRSRTIGAIVLVGGGVFGLLGGEYSTFDWLQLKRGIHTETASIARLHQDIDSLTTYARALERDSATQERVAREKFGMIRNGEHLYRVVPVEEKAGDQAGRPSEHR